MIVLLAFFVVFQITQVIAVEYFPVRSFESEAYRLILIDDLCYRIMLDQLP